MKFTRIATALALAGLSLGAYATNGYFSHGYGMKAKGMAGVSTAMTDNAFFGANNPATAAFAGNRLDLGVDLFSPHRKATNGWMESVGFDLAFQGDSEVESDSNFFLVPEFGYNYMYSPNLALGITVYGNGGMNTDYDAAYKGPNAFGLPCNSTNLHGGCGTLGVDLMQLIIAPTIAYKIAPNHSLGISPLLGYQRFEAKGLDLFGGLSQDPSNLTNNDHDDSFGYGVRVGYYGQITPTFSIGAAYASKMAFEEFDDYKGLFAEGGDFDIPENWNIGVSWQATPTLRLAADYQRINYSDVDSVGNPVSNIGGCMMMMDFENCMGGNRGPGFGWDDIDIWKLGAEYKYSKEWTFRGGYSYSDNPISGGKITNQEFGEVTLNMLAPAVIQHHVTLGFTYTRPNNDEMTMAFMYAFNNDVKGDSFFNGFPMSNTGAQDKIEMYQYSVGFQYSWK
jgi:long-chain fatty acid transport protein